MKPSSPYRPRRYDFCYDFFGSRNYYSKSGTNKSTNFCSKSGTDGSTYSRLVR